VEEVEEEELTLLQEEDELLEEFERIAPLSSDLNSVCVGENTTAPFLFDTISF
jgi:hypothetical protein